LLFDREIVDIVIRKHILKILQITSKIFTHYFKFKRTHIQNINIIRIIIFNTGLTQSFSRNGDKNREIVAIACNIGEDRFIIFLTKQRG